MIYKESKLQQRCVAWFRREYPEWAPLFFHVRNENSGGEKAGGRAVAEGVTAGVADLMLQVPNERYTGLAIEMKDKSGSQRYMQKWYQQFYEMSGGKYVVAKDFDTFVAEVEDYLESVDPEMTKAARALQVKMEQDIERRKQEKELRDERKALKELQDMKEGVLPKTADEKKEERRVRETEKARKRLAKLLGK